MWSAWQSRYQRLSRWQRGLLEAVMMLALFSAVLAWNGRHLLPSAQPAPSLGGTLLVSKHTISNLPDSRPPVTIDWQQQPRTLVYFFAPWCGVCRVSMPGLNSLPRDNLQVIAVALDWQSAEEVQQMVQETGFDGTVMLASHEIGQQWQIRGYPSYYVVDNQGLILHQDTGLSTPPGLWLRTHL
ncbi:thioredoxin-like domain-containing protein [Parathalassolituus penaei]|uniref:Thioredoxin domain-containing protein n=1 Tax=Parathalassolituus penaei TaxID=2997323 RepID=A0A9X3EBN3_9GAMM|nr:thioredoxin-like domain-containing protein [Parathalassolituus penaei]MCY0963760.1 thioredoxin domain-containing protein [Parathalassolituus penaei]